MGYRTSFLLLLLSPLVVQELALAQRASDPNAIDLTLDLIRIDTNGLRTVALPINVGVLGGDTSDDLLLEQDLYDTNGNLPFVHQVAIMSEFGAVRLSTVGIGGIARIAGNFDGLGVLDVATTRFTDSGLQTRIDWAENAPVYFDSSHSTIVVDPSASNAQPMLVGDYTRDGIDDLFLISNSRVYLYPGSMLWHNVPSVLPSDSAALGRTAYPYVTGALLGQFDRSGYPSMCIASSGWENGTGRTAYFRVQYYPNKTSTGGTLWSTVPQDLFLDTIANSDEFVYSAAVLAYDITGDGIDDLVVCDSAHIYIFKGGPGFGTHTLRKSDADFVITSPALLDPAHSGRSTFASSIFAAGDLTGTGIPYLGVSGTTESGSALIPVTWLYAGGGALDTYFDGWIDSTHPGGVRVARRRGQTSRDGLAVLRNLNSSNECDLLSHGTEKLPHSLFSSVNEGKPKDAIGISYLPNNRVEISLDQMSSESSMEPMNLLGQRLPITAERSLSNGMFTLDLSSLPTGLYFALVRDQGQEWVVKLMR